MAGWANRRHWAGQLRPLTVIGVRSYERGDGLVWACEKSFSFASPERQLAAMLIAEAPCDPGAQDRRAPAPNSGKTRGKTRKVRP